MTATLLPLTPLKRCISRFHSPSIYIGHLYNNVIFRFPCPLLSSSIHYSSPTLFRGVATPVGVKQSFVIITPSMSLLLLTRPCQLFLTPYVFHRFHLHFSPHRGLIQFSYSFFPYPFLSQTFTVNLPYHFKLPLSISPSPYFY